MSICNEKVFEAVFLQHSKALHHFLYYKTGDAASAEDLMQDAFIRLWNNCRKVVVAKAKSYLFTVANNLFLDKVKHHKVVLKFQQTPQKTATAESPEYLMEEKEFKARLENAISQLPAKQRSVFLLNRIDKKTYKEIAKLEGVSVKAIEKRMGKALATLRRLTKRI